MSPVGSSGLSSIARWIVAAIAVTLVMGATPQRADSKSGPSKVDPSLLAAAKAAPNVLFPVIVRGAGTDGKTRAKAAEALLASARGTRRTLRTIRTSRAGSSLVSTSPASSRMATRADTVPMSLASSQAMAPRRMAPGRGSRRGRTS